jgi:hypothetical protein
MAGRRQINKVRVWYDDGSMEKWEAPDGSFGAVTIEDTQVPPPDPSPPGTKPTPISYVSITMPISARLDLNGKANSDG